MESGTGSPAVKGSSHLLRASKAPHSYSSYMETRNLQTSKKSELNVKSFWWYLENLKKKIKKLEVATPTPNNFLKTCHSSVLQDKESDVFGVFSLFY